MKVNRTNSIKLLVYLISFILIILIIQKIFDIYRQTQNSKIIKREPIVNQYDIIFGADTASNVLFLYGNYTCQYCRRFFSEVFPKLNEKYIQTGKIKLVYKIMVNDHNEKLIKAMKTIICIHKYGNFEKLNQLLLEEPNVVYLPDFEEMIEHFIDSDPLVAECIMGQESEIYLLDIKKEFYNFGFKGTPTFVIKNKYYTGFLPYNKFEQWILKNITHN
jgi:protein-disulfide isomerase